jgi:hypothetical protein
MRNKGFRHAPFLFLAAAVLASCAVIPARRGFETGTFEAWYTEFPEPDSAAVVTRPVREGKYAAAFTSAPGDRRITGGFRTEVSEPWAAAPFRTEMWYRFSIFIPEDWPEADVRCLIAQWHGWPDLHRGEAWRSPVAALEYRNGMFIIRICFNDQPVQKDNSLSSNNKTILYKSDRYAVKGVWHDFAVNAFFDPSGKGFFRVWIDGNKIVDYTGPLGYNDAFGPWFKMGLYRDESPETFTVYHDDYRRGTSAESVGVEITGSGCVFKD